MIGLVAGEEAVFSEFYAIGTLYPLFAGIAYSVLSGIFESAMYHYAITKEGGLCSERVVESRISGEQKSK